MATHRADPSDWDWDFNCCWDRVDHRCRNLGPGSWIDRWCKRNAPTAADRRIFHFRMCLGSAWLMHMPPG